MAKITNSFAEWRRVTRNAPDRLADLFLSRYDSVPPETLRALIASAPDRDTLVQNTRIAHAKKEAPLSGIPYMLQDLFDVEGLTTRCGAQFQAAFEVPLEENCLLYQKLASLGASLLAKTVPSEFGIGARGRNKKFGDCPHADGLRYVCGGGAGTSAHAVSAGWVPLAFGLDSSAGIRIPAAFHGLFGFRMGSNEYARVGVFPSVPSLESIGFMTAQIEDLQHTIEAFHPKSPLISPVKPAGYLLEDPSVQLDTELKASMMHLLRHLDIDDCPHANKLLRRAFKDSSETMVTIEARELYSIHQYWIEEYRSHYEENLLRRIEAGQICTIEKADHAANVQQRIREAMVDFFQKYDYLVIPISSQPTPDKGQWNGQLENDLLRLNAPTSLAFLPALILPFPCDEGRHSAIQLVLNPKKIHQTAKILEQVSSFYD